MQVLSHYSNGWPTCSCCGEKSIEFLSIHHLNGGGNRHRKIDKIGNTYAWLRRNKYPDGYSVLCMNCNFALGHFGYCPHAIKGGVPFV